MSIWCRERGSGVEVRWEYTDNIDRMLQRIKYGDEVLLEMDKRDLDKEGIDFIDLSDYEEGVYTLEVESSGASVSDITEDMYFALRNKVVEGNHDKLLGRSFKVKGGRIEMVGVDDAVEDIVKRSIDILYGDIFGSRIGTHLRKEIFENEVDISFVREEIEKVINGLGLVVLSLSTTKKDNEIMVDVQLSDSNMMKVDKVRLKWTY